MSKQLFYPIKYSRQPSKRDGKPYTTIIFEDVATGDDYKTYVYSTCKNRVMWQDIIDHKDQDQLIFFDDLVIKDKAKRIIDADCAPQVLTRERAGELREIVDQYRREQAAQQQPKAKQPDLPRKRSKVVKFKKGKPPKPRPQLPPDLWEIT